MSDTLLRWILLPPLVAALWQTAGGLRWRVPRGATRAMAGGAPLLSFGLGFIGLLSLVRLPEQGRLLEDHLFTWIAAGDFGAELGLRLDPLSAVVVLVVTGVAAAIQIAALGLLDEGAGESDALQRALAVTHFGTFALLLLVLADNLLGLALGFALLGVATSLLQGFWYADPARARASMRGLFWHRMGDAALLLGLLLIVLGGSPGSIAASDLSAAEGALAGQRAAVPELLASFLGGFGLDLEDFARAELVALCFAIAAMVRSAVLPFGVWLSRGPPQPAPAAAFVQTVASLAGIYLLCRLSELFAAAPIVSGGLAWVGAFSAVFGAALALIEEDVQRILASATISQMGIAFLAIGCGAFDAGLWHAVTHAWFMSLLVLSTGVATRNLRGQTSLGEMGGLWRFLPRSRWLWLVGALALVGFPYFSGFFSRDGALVSAGARGGGLLLVAGLLAAALTALFVGRFFCRMFLGPCHAPAPVRSSIREPGAVVFAPLLALAILAGLGGLFIGPSDAFVWVEDANSFASFVGPALAAALLPPEPAQQRLLSLLVAVASALGGVFAWVLYFRNPQVLSATRRMTVFPEWLLGHHLGQPAASSLLTSLWRRLAGVARGFDERVVDGALRGLGMRSWELAAAALSFDATGQRSHAFWIVLGALALASVLAQGPG